MGLISKIEDKLHGDKGSSDSSKLQKSSYENQSGNSHLQNPISSGGSQGYGSSTHGTTGTQGYGGSTTGTTGSSAMPGSYGDDGRARVEDDGYGRSSGGYSKTDQRETSGGYGSSSHDPRTTTSSSEYRTEPREPYDPYSSKGQNTAANAATGYPSGSSREDYGSSKHANEPNIPRSREGGILNPSSSDAARNPESIPTAGGQRVGSSQVNDPYSSSSAPQDPYSTSTHNSSGHPIRDAAMVGGAGAAVGGATGYGASKYHDDRSAQDAGMPGYGQHASSTHPQDVSYMNRSGDAGGLDSRSQPGGIAGSNTMGSGMQSGGMMGSNTTGGSSAPSGMDPKKMGGAYEAGYRDAMEHAKEQMGLK